MPDVSRADKMLNKLIAVVTSTKRPTLSNGYIITNSIRSKTNSQTDVQSL